MAATQYAWAAGFVDGEGCFSINYHRPTNHHRPGLFVSQIESPPLEILKDLFGGSINCTPARGRQRPLMTWQITNWADLVNTVETLQPYLVVKAAHAELMLAYLHGPGRRYPNGGGRRKLSDADFAARGEFAEQMTKLNRRGGPAREPSNSRST
jgi:hypothetical protein